MKRIKAWLLCVLLLVSAVICRGETNAKYIFLFIGDGMGENHRIAADYYWKNKQLLEGKQEQDIKGLEMNELPVSGMVRTFPKTGDVTDSAASITAMSSGHKVNNGSLNYDQASGMEFEPMSVFSRKMGYKNGVVSTTPLNHATPAGIYAIQKGRGDYYDIALQLAASNVDYFGATYVMGVPEDKDNIRQLAKDNGFDIVENKDAIMALTARGTKVWAFDTPGMPLAIDRPQSLTLADYTKKGIDILENPGGFFMMVESGEIDHAAHSNDGSAMVYEMVAFNDAIKQGLDFYKAHPDETLIVITADHETGGLTLDKDKLANPKICNVIDGQSGSYNAASQLLKEIEKAKPDFDGIISVMKDFFGIIDLTEHETASVKAAYNKSGYAKGDYSYGQNRYLTAEFLKIVSARAGMNWTTMSHTGTPVKLTAIGVGAEMFEGNLDNTLICWYIRELMIKKHEMQLQKAK